MKKQLLLLISGIMLFSCANEDDNIKKHSTSVESSSPIPIVGSFKELYELSGIKFENLFNNLQMILYHINYKITQQ